MSSKKFARFTSMKVKTLSVAVFSSLLFYSGSHAAGLGKLTVLSSLGQPLRAEIELTSVANEDIGNLAPRLANLQAFEQAKVDFNSTLSSLKFAIEERGSRYFVLITSPQSINEPFLEMLVELTSSSGRLVREYSLLIDPPQLSVNQTPTRIEENTLNKLNAFILPSGRNSSGQLRAKQATQQSQYYQIKEGDTLGKIAKQFKAQGVSLEQMLVALQRNNPSAFIKDNVNLIRAGKVLAIPTTNEIRLIDPAEAKQIVLAQSADFNTYRSKLADQVEQSLTEENAGTKKIDSGKITAKVAELPTVINEAKDKLKLSKEPLPGQASNISEEEKIAKQKALAEASTRLKELEQNTAKLQKMLDLQSQETTSQSQTAKPTDLPKIQASVVTPEVTPEPKSTSLKDSIRYLPYGAVLLALLGVLGIYFAKRKKITKSIKSEHHLLGAEINVQDNQQMPDDNSLLNSQTTPSVKLSNEDEVDPLLQAKAYMAGGNDEQAEEVLVEALHAQPDYHAARLALLAIYVQRQDARNFEALARQLHDMTEGLGADWEQAASMGKTLDPENSLYIIKKEMPIPSSAFALAEDINQSIDEVLQPIAELNPESQQDKKDAADLDLSFPIPEQEKLVQIETKMINETEEESKDTDHFASFDFSGIDLELPKTPEVHKEKV